MDNKVSESKENSESLQFKMSDCEENSGLNWVKSESKIMSSVHTENSFSHQATTSTIFNLWSWSSFFKTNFTKLLQAARSGWPDLFAFYWPFLWSSRWFFPPILFHFIMDLKVQHFRDFSREELTKFPSVIHLAASKYWKM